MRLSGRFTCLHPHHAKSVHDESFVWFLHHPSVQLFKAVYLVAWLISRGLEYVSDTDLFYYKQCDQSSMSQYFA